MTSSNPAHDVALGPLVCDRGTRPVFREETFKEFIHRELSAQYVVEMEKGIAEWLGGLVVVVDFDQYRTREN